MPVVNDVKLTDFCVEIFKKIGVSEADAKIVADNLATSDLRGIPSHGVARLKRYVDGIKGGIILPNVKPKILKETPVTVAISGENGLGQPAGVFAMNLAIEKAKKNGLGFATVRNSNHYGIAGYYALMALKHDLIGISLTNSEPLVVPTFSKDMIIGTNPISVAIPAGKERPYVLDMATSVVPRGKFEVYLRQEKPVPLGWAVDQDGLATTDTKLVIDNMTNTAGGGILPLGGEGELLSGHKGYGLSLLVDILSGVLAGADFGPYVKSKKRGTKTFINVGHFFGAVKIENFIELDKFKSTMDSMIQQLKNSQKAKGQNRVYIHGEKEFEKWEEYKKNGLPLGEKVVETLKQLGQELGVPYNL
ncbi:MAG: Ldh family oxidoreductase [candidate division Zixibacteria bacterium]|nr:Ldh family oxidoreductase [candidate division Zixibacteria bacterium]